MPWGCQAEVRASWLRPVLPETTYRPVLNLQLKMKEWTLLTFPASNLPATYWDSYIDWMDQHRLQRNTARWRQRSCRFGRLNCPVEDHSNHNVKKNPSDHTRLGFELLSFGCITHVGQTKESSGRRLITQACCEFDGYYLRLSHLSSNRNVRLRQ